MTGTSGGDNSNGESEKAGKAAFYSDFNFNLFEFWNFASHMVKKEQMQAAFADYTAETATEYTYCDKLVFIDLIVGGLNYIEEYRKGRKDGQLYYQFPHDKCFEKIIKLSYRAIKAVIEWEN